MGDRGNIKIQGGSHFPHPVYFYTHWSGSDLKQIVATALDKGRERWHDPSYLARIIFSELTGGDNGLTGYGIDTSGGGDNEYPFVVVDFGKKTVHEEEDMRERFCIGFRGDSIKKPMPFESFIALMAKQAEASKEAD